MKTVKQFKKKEFIYFEGNFVNSIYILLSGDIKLTRISEDGKEVIFDLINVGEIIGISSLLSEKYNEYSIAIENSDVLEVNKNLFIKILKENTALEGLANTQIERKIKNYLKRMEELAFYDAPRRIISFLFYLSEFRGKKVGDEIFISSNLTNQEIAEYTFCSRQTVSKVLNNLKKHNFIRFGRKKIVFSNSIYFQK